VRDALLAVSGKLDPSLGGPPLALEVKPDGLTVVKEQGLPAPSARWRRSVYVLARRNYHLSLLNVFDQPVVATNCTARMSSAVVSQALTMLNDRFVLEQAGYLAERVAREAGPDPAKRIALAFQTALGRPPRAAEVTWCTDLLRRHDERRLDGQKALAHLCHVLLNTNEFLYVP
jgi:hypothetical protein